MNKRERHYFRIHEPYCLKQVGRGRYIKLNRDYKPIAVESQETASYEGLPLIALPGLTPQVAAALSARGSNDVEAVYRYNDGCVPTSSAANMRAYLARLGLLAKLKVPSEAMAVWIDKAAGPARGAVPAP